MFKLNFETTYQNLPDVFYQKLRPDPVKDPQLLKWNESLADELQIGSEIQDPLTLAPYFSGNTWPKDLEGLAQAYSGHQFGHFSPLLGDGRALLMGEVMDRSGGRRDIHLKGSGPTRFSRRGDGRSALGPALREYVMSEAMHALHIPTTRALAVLSTGEFVYRQEGELLGGIVVRVASSHVRVGTFEFARQQNNPEVLKALADYVIARHYSAEVSKDKPYRDLFRGIVKRQAQLIARWMSVGFIHGVMNTDNMTISGETIDYGPCAFMDTYNPDTVYSYIDTHGRYAYGNQPPIAQWNLNVLGTSMLGLFSEDSHQAERVLQEELSLFAKVFNEEWLSLMGAKLGFENSDDKDKEFILEFLNLLYSLKMDYTLSFRYLMQTLEENSSLDISNLIVIPDAFKEWVMVWKEYLPHKGSSFEQALKIMSFHNPLYIPRNHLVDQALRSVVESQDISPFEDLLNILSQPFELQRDKERYLLPPTENQKIKNTFCGT